MSYARYVEEERVDKGDNKCVFISWEKKMYQKKSFFTSNSRKKKIIKKKIEEATGF